MYRAPLKDLQFVLDKQLRATQLAATSRFSDYSSDLAESILREADRFASGVLEPLNQSGDRQGATWTADGVRAPDGFPAAYKQFVADGWPQLGIDAQHGGQGVPLVLATAVEEIWFGCNLAFILCPQLGRGAVEALMMAGSPELKARFLPRMVSGEWTGTMNLTEPQSGSDLSTIRTRAQPEGDHFRIFGQKIFITYGEHDMAANIVHLVLARIDGAPAGIKGISLFVVPRFVPESGERNDLRCVSIEHKLGIHGSPTCVMAYGDRQGALGFLVGEANHGLEYMFVMMNSARLSVGVQGIGLAERAYQQALEWARTRVQGRPMGASATATIIQHPDVRRMLLMMKSGIEAMRVLALYAALQQDLASAQPEALARATAQARGELLTPIVKGWCTEQVNDLVSLGVQIHGGMGFIEETGIAQTLRDARITAIYEGTTGIQANDLLGRKLLRDKGVAMGALLDDLGASLQSGAGAQPEVAAITAAAVASLGQLRTVSGTLAALAQGAPAEAYAVSVPYLKLCGLALGGALLAQAAVLAAAGLAAAGDDAAFLRAKIQTAGFYMTHWLPQAEALAQVVRAGAGSVMNAETDLL